MSKVGRIESILKIMKKIPKGKVVSYGSLAKLLGTSPRAVGQLMKHNQDPKNIPCYKVVCSDGSIGGYSRGIKRKIRMLEKDGIKIINQNGKLKIDKKYFHKFTL